MQSIAPRSSSHFSRNVGGEYVAIALSLINIVRVIVRDEILALIVRNYTAIMSIWAVHGQTLFDILVTTGD